MDNTIKNLIAELRNYKRNGNIIDVGETITSSDFLTKATKNATPANNSGKVSKLESDGYIDKDFIKTIKGGSAITLTAKQNLTAGQPVGASNGIDDYVAKSFVRHKSTLTGNFYAGYSSLKIIWLSANKFVITYMENTSGYNRYYICGEINLSTLSISFGSAVTQSSAGTSATDGICAVDTDKFVIFNNNDASTTLNGYVCTVSGTTITINGNNTLASFGYSIYMDALQLGTNSGVLMNYYGTSSYRKLVSFSVSGTTITYGTPLASTATFVKGTRMCKVSATSFCWLYNGDGKMYVASISSGTITLGTGVSVESSADTSDTNSRMHRCSYLTNGYVLMTYPKSGLLSAGIRIVSISGTTPTAGTEVTVSSATITSICVATLSTTQCLVFVNEYVYLVTRSGTTISSYPIKTILGNMSYIVSDVIYMGTYYLVFQNIGSNFAIDFFIEGEAMNFIGIAQATVSKDASVEVMVGGIDENQSGLHAGSYYLVNNGGLTEVAPNVTVNTLDDMNIVKSISSTKIII